MKRQMKRLFTVMLALILLLGVLPTGVSGDSYIYIDEARVFVHYPMGGQAPNMEGKIVGSADYSIEFVHFFDCYEGQPIGAFLENSLFTAGRLYACQVSLIAKGDYRFTSYTDLYINGRIADCNAIYDDGANAFFTVFFRAALGTVTVSFDGNGYGQAHAPIEVPKGGTIADAVPDVSVLDLHENYERFIMWARDPLAEPYSYNAVEYTDSMDEDTTLYAICSHCVKSVDLYVEVPDDCLTADVYGPNIIVPARADYTVTTDNFYYGLVDGHLHYDLVYVGPFEKGRTYYSQVTVNTQVAGALPKVNLYGAKLISAWKIDDFSFDVLFSVTVPGGDSITNASVYVETPKYGQSAKTNKPVIANLTPGLLMSAVGWFEEPQPSGVYYEGSFEAGKTYYLLLNIGGYYSKYNLSYDTLKLKLLGQNVKLVEMIDMAEVAGFPNFAGALVAVTIPKYYEFTVEVPYGGGKIRYSRAPNYKWVTLMDFYEEEGEITLEAKPDADHLFKMWYDADSYERLSKTEKYSFYLDHNVHIKASFVQKPPFVDVGAWDYFYEPVMWAIEHEPAITGGTDDTHFSPKEACTREQIMTFLWKANGAPTPFTTTNPFSDVKEGRYYYKAVLWAVENGITSGVSEGKFGVGQSCTREQAMTFLWKAKGSPSPSASSNPFSDVKKGKYYYNAVLWAYHRLPQVTSGVSTGVFGVGETCTRAQIITFLAKVYGPAG